jgi:hypothetical protein
MPRTRNNVLLMLIYIVFTTLILYYFDGGIKIGSFTVMYRYMLAAVLIVIGLFCFLAEADLSRAPVLAKDALVHFLPYMLGLGISVVIWIIRRPGLTTMTRGGFYVIYMFIALLTALSYVAVFGRNSVYVLLAALVAGNLLVIYSYGIKTGGASAWVSNYIQQIVTFTQAEDAFPQIEDADIQFAFGCMILYFAFDDGEKLSRRIMCIAISLVFFAVGLKRITVFALVAALLIAGIAGRKKRRSDVQLVRLFAAVLAAALFAYVVVGKIDLLEWLYDYFDIDTKGRTDFMTFIDTYYYISPAYIGYGFGYVNRLMEVLYNAGRIDAAVLHNDILRLYVELGFWGFIVFAVTYWYTRLDFFIRQRSRQVFRIVLAVVIYLTVTYLTDNTLFYFNINLAAFTAMLSAERPMSTGPERPERPVSDTITKN